MTGVVIRVLLSRGFGFIRGDDDHTSRMFHASDCVPRSRWDFMREGLLVTFTPTSGGDKNNGLRATEVRVVE